MGFGNILFPLFLKCYDITTDIYWINVFEKLAYGRPPFGTYLVDDTLRCNYINREFIYRIDPVKDIRVIFNELTGLLETKLDMKSTYQTEVNEPVVSWSDVRKKSQKEMYIQLYVVKLMKKYSLNITVARELMSNIIVYVTLNYISNHNIIYHNNFIDDIKNVEINGHKFSITKERETSSNKHTKVINKKLSSKWEKHISKLL